MGNSGLKEFTYAVPTNNPKRKDNETDIYRAAESIGKDIFDIGDKVTLPELFERRFNNPNLVGFAHRVYDPNTQSFTNEVKTYTNGEYFEMMMAVGSAILGNDLAPEINEYKDFRLRFVGMYSPNSIQQAVVDTACAYYGLTVVPIYDTLGEEATVFIFNQTKMRVVCTSAKHLEKLIKLNNEQNMFQHLKTIIVLDPENLPDHLSSSNKEGNIILYKWSHLLDMGRKKIIKFPKLNKDSDETIYIK